MSTIDSLGSEIDDDLSRFGKEGNSGTITPAKPPQDELALEDPSPGDWVLIDLNTYTIIHRLFLTKLVASGGDYMVLPMRSSVISAAELKTNEVAIKLLSTLKSTRRLIQSGCSWSTAKLRFPSHDMPFLVPIESREYYNELKFQPIIEQIVGEISSRVNGLMLDCPTPTNWVVVDVANTEIIQKASLDQYMVSCGEYMVLSTLSSTVSGDGLGRSREM